MADTNDTRQPVTDEQDQAANEPITLTAEGPFGIVSWTLGEHALRHMRDLAADPEGRVGYLEFARDVLCNQASALVTTMCIDKTPGIRLIAKASNPDINAPTGNETPGSIPDYTPWCRLTSS